jgi:magnesium transporter
VVQGLANKTINFDTTWKKILKEISIALIIGLTFSLLIFAYNMVFSGSIQLTLTVSSALFSVILFASVFGTFIPLILNRFKIDPAVATGPFITTSNDIIGMFIYLGLGRLLYGLFA